MEWITSKVVVNNQSDERWKALQRKTPPPHFHTPRTPRCDSEAVSQSLNATEVCCSRRYSRIYLCRGLLVLRTCNLDMVVPEQPDPRRKSDVSDRSHDRRLSHLARVLSMHRLLEPSCNLSPSSNSYTLHAPPPTPFILRCQCTSHSTTSLLTVPPTINHAHVKHRSVPSTCNSTVPLLRIIDA